MNDFIKSLLGNTNKNTNFVSALTGVPAQTVQKSVVQGPAKPAATPTKTVVSSNPSAVSPAVKTPAAQAYVQSKMPSTPAVSTPTSMPNTQNYMYQAAPQTPTATATQTQTTTPSTKDTYLEAYKKYQESQKLSAEEKSAREAYNNFLAEQSKAIAGREGRGFGAPVELVRGEQEKLLKQTQPEAARLQGEIGIAQTAREAEINAAKSGLDMTKDLMSLDAEQAKVAREAAKPIVVDGVAYSQQADGSLKPLTTKEQEAFNLSEGQSRYAINPTTGQYELVASKGKTYAPGTGSSTTTGTVSPYRAEKAANVIAQVDEALGMISPYTAGLIGSVSGLIPGTQAKDLQKAIDSIKANIGFDELQAMRDASKTGGALGQVAVQELASLQATLGSLDRTQSPQALYKNLQDIRNRYSKVAGIVSQIQGGQSSSISRVEYPAGSGQYYNVDTNGDMTPAQ